MCVWVREGRKCVGAEGWNLAAVAAWDGELFCPSRAVGWPLLYMESGKQVGRAEVK
jgi:hypothetical protein